MTTELKHNAFALNVAIEEEGYTVVRDGGQQGTVFAWLGDQWCVSSLDSWACKTVGRIAVVTTKAGVDPDEGLNQACIGCDFDVPYGEWIVDADDLDDLGNAVEVLWIQED